MIKLTEEEITRERFRREDRRDSFPAAILSVAVHGALFAGLFTVFQWNTAPETVYAELWAPEDVSGGNDPSGVAEKLPEETGRDEADAPEKKAAEPEPEPEPEPQPEPEPEPEPEPAPPPEPAGPTPEELAAQEAREAERLEEEAIARQAREEMEARRAEEERIAQERARAEEIERMRQEAIEAERRRALEEEKRLEEERLAQERLAEAARKAEEARRAEEARIAEEQRKAEEARIAEKKRQAAEAEARRIAEELRVAEEKRQAEEAARKAAAEKKAREEAEERRRVAQRFREQELARLSAKVDPNAQRSGTTTGDRRNFRRSLTGSALATWSNQVRSCIRPNITIDVPSTTRPGQYRAVYSLQLLPTGEQVGTPKLVTPSGWPAYDAAVARAIRRCNPLPRPGAGEDMPREISLSFDPVEDKQ